MTRPAPIALFIFNRPKHLRRTLTSLAKCEGFDQSPVVVFGDGPRKGADVPGVDAARAVAREMLGSRPDYRFADTNIGLAKSIISGVSELSENYGRVVVVEDDLELSLGFLSYMNAALDRYVHDEIVYQISGHMFEVPEFRDRRSAAVLPLTTTWGWATWARAWRRFDVTCSGWREMIDDRRRRRQFNLGGAYDYATMLEARMAGGRASWGIQWYWAQFRDNALGVFPPRSLVRNGGFDGSGSNGRGLFRKYASTTGKLGSFDFSLPDPVRVDADLDVVRRAIWRQNGGLAGHAVDRVKRMVSVRR